MNVKFASFGMVGEAEDSKKRVNWHSPVLRYGFALGLLLIAYSIDSALSNLITSPEELFYIAVVLAARFGGMGPGLLAAIGFLVIDLYYYVPPADSFMIYNVNAGIQFATTLAVAFLISGLTASLAAARKKALDYARQKTQFAASVSHEIRTPLNAIIGLSELLCDKNILDTEKEFCVQTIRESGSSLLDLVNDILDFSKLDLGKMQLEPLEFDPRTEIDQCVNVIKRHAEIKGIHIQTNIHQAVPLRLKGDSGRISQVLVNLLSNAIKFTEPGGSVKLEVSHLELTEDQVSLRLQVTDTGVGIPRQLLAHIFEAFYQVRSARTRNHEGTGLGLTISKHLAELMGGELGVTSELGKGSCFWLVLPLQRVVGSECEIPVKDENFRLPIFLNSEKHILVVEDNRVNQVVVVKMLEKLGYRTTAVSNGVECIQQLSKISYHVILMDCQMPELDGYAATLEIRRLEIVQKRPRIPIIALTAYSSLENRAKCFEVGMDDYISKPIKMSELAPVMQRWARDSEVGRQAIQIHGDKLLPSLDTRVLKRLEDLDQVKNSTFITDLVDTFVKHTPARLNSIEEAIIQNNTTSLEQIAHTLKSACGHLGASKMVEFCTRLEAMGSKRAIDGAAAILQDLTVEFFQVAKRLQDFR